MAIAAKTTLARAFLKDGNSYALLEAETIVQKGKMGSTAKSEKLSFVINTAQHPFALRLKEGFGFSDETLKKLRECDESTRFDI